MVQATIISSWWLFVIPMACVILIVAFILCRNRRIGFLALFSVFGIIFVLTIDVISRYYNINMNIYGYSEGVDYVDDITKLHLSSCRGSIWIIHKTIRWGRQDWQKKVDMFRKRNSAIFLMAQEARGDGQLVAAERRAFAHWWEHYFQNVALNEAWKPGTNSTISGFAFGIRIWLLYFPLSIFPIFWISLYLRRIFRKRLGCCRCGYDLRAHKTGDKCPECGQMIPAALTTTSPSLDH